MSERILFLFYELSVCSHTFGYGHDVALAEGSRADQTECDAFETTVKGNDRTHWCDPLYPNKHLVQGSCTSRTLCVYIYFDEYSALINTTTSPTICTFKMFASVYSPFRCKAYPGGGVWVLCKGGMGKLVWTSSLYVHRQADRLRHGRLYRRTPNFPQNSKSTGVSLPSRKCMGLGYLGVIWGCNMKRTVIIDALSILCMYFCLCVCVCACGYVYLFIAYRHKLKTLRSNMQSMRFRPVFVWIFFSFFALFPVYFFSNSSDIPIKTQQSLTHIITNENMHYGPGRCIHTSNRMRFLNICIQSNSRARMFDGNADVVWDGFLFYENTKSPWWT